MRQLFEPRLVEQLVASRIVKIFELAFPLEVTLYHCPRYGLSSAPFLPILSVTMDGKG